MHLSPFLSVYLQSPLAGPPSIRCNDPWCQCNICPTCVPFINPNRKKAQCSVSDSPSPFPGTSPGRRCIHPFVTLASLETKTHQYQLFSSSGHKEGLSCHRAGWFWRMQGELWSFLAKNWSWFVGAIRLIPCLIPWSYSCNKTNGLAIRRPEPHAI